MQQLCLQAFCISIISQQAKHFFIRKKKNLYSYRTVSHAKGYRLSEDLYLSNSLLVLC